MRLSRSQQVYLVVLGVGLAALVLDKTVFAPAPAGGVAPAPSPAAVGTPGSEPEAAETAPEVVTIAVADRLRAVAARRGLDPTATADAFHPSEEWLGAGVDTSGGHTRTQIIRDFTEAYRLVGVLTSDGHRAAVIEFVATGKSRVVQVNDELGQFVLVSVQKQSATFLMDDITVELKLELRGPEGAIKPHSAGGPKPVPSADADGA